MTISSFNWKHFLFRRGYEGFETELKKQAFKSDFAGRPELGDRNANAGTDSRMREGVGQDRIGPLFGSVEEKGWGGNSVPSGEVLLFWFNLQTFSHGLWKWRRGDYTRRDVDFGHVPRKYGCTHTLVLCPTLGFWPQLKCWSLQVFLLPRVVFLLL